MLDILSLNSMAISGFCFNCYLHTHTKLTELPHMIQMDNLFISFVNCIHLIITCALPILWDQNYSADI